MYLYLQSTLGQLSTLETPVTVKVASSITPPLGKTLSDISAVDLLQGSLVGEAGVAVD